MAFSQHISLTASAVSTVSIDASATMITVVNRTQTGQVYFTVDGSTPTIGGAGTYLCMGAKAVATPGILTPTTVKLICLSAVDISVVGESV